MSLNNSFKKISKSYRYRKIKTQFEQCVELSDLDFRSNTIFKNHQLHMGNENCVIVKDCNEVTQNGNVVVEQVVTNEQTNNQIVANEQTNYQYLSSENIETSEGDVSNISSDDNNNEGKNNDSIVFLRNWALKNNLTHNALSELLVWFTNNPNLAGLPKCARSLLKTPSSLTVEQMGHGEFFYFALEERLKSFIHKFENIKDIILYFVIDGLPLHKSTNLSFWPNMCKVTISTKANLTFPVFTVAIYCGIQKPPLEPFFEKFVIDLL